MGPLIFKGESESMVSSLFGNLPFSYLSQVGTWTIVGTCISGT